MARALPITGHTLQGVTARKLIGKDEFTPNDLGYTGGRNFYPEKRKTQEKQNEKEK